MAEQTTEPENAGPSPADQLKGLARLVGRMRDCQKAYFRTRSPQALAESKNLERHVDEAVRAVLHPEHPSLFEEGL